MLPRVSGAMLILRGALPEGFYSMNLACIKSPKLLSVSFVCSALFVGSAYVQTAKKELDHSQGSSTSASNLQGSGVLVPFVGCESDGQVGPVKAPSGKGKVVSVVADAAKQLAYYKSEQGVGVLAPRRWHCFGVYGSNGYALYVSPEQITASNVLSSTWTGFCGPAIELAVEFGDTSGRFAVARVIARVFPDHKSFVESVIAEGEPTSSFPFGPYPEDKLTYRNKRMVEYETPANTGGLGTSWRLKKNAHPVSGVAVLIGDTPDLMLLAVRLPPELNDLAPPVINQLERDAEGSGK